MDEVTRRMLEKIHQPGLFDVLVKRLSASEFNTVLLGVFNQHVAGLDATGLLQKYRLFVKVYEIGLPGQPPSFLAAA